MGRKLINEADRGSANMTAVSTSWVQRDTKGILTQFMGWQMRIAEQFIGKRLTPIEKARLFATFSTLYGIPAGMAAVTGFWPWREHIRDKAAEDGVALSDDFISNTIFNGIVSAGMKAGGLGNHAWGESHGPSGNPLLYEMLYDDQTWLELAASTTIMTEFADQAWALVGRAAMHTDGVELDWSDVGPFFRNISTINNAYKIYAGMGVQAYMSKNGIPIDEMSAADGLIQGIFGVQNHNTLEGFADGKAVKRRQGYLRELEGVFKKLHRKMFNAFNANDINLAADYNRQIIALFKLGNLQPSERIRMARSARRDQKTLVDRYNDKASKLSPDHFKAVMERTKRGKE